LLLSIRSDVLYIRYRVSEISNLNYLHQDELAARWRLSERTLEGWRSRKTGPSYIKLGGKVVYAMQDIEAYERRRRAETHSSVLGSWRG
jgi:hypothetical protein